MDPVGSKITEKFAEQSLQQGAAAPGKVDAGDQMQFEQALNAPQDPAAAQNVTQVDLLGNQVEGASRPTLGDAILDEYQYVIPMGKSAKENMIATRYQDRELFAGGVFAAANHLSTFCKQVDILTCLGGEFSRHHPRQPLDLPQRAVGPGLLSCAIHSLKSCGQRCDICGSELV